MMYALLCLLLAVTFQQLAAFQDLLHYRQRFSSAKTMVMNENIDFGQKSRVQIEYCPGCKWMLRSAWMAQEILSTFEKEVREVALVPSPKSGTFIISVDKVVIWDRRDPATPGFPEIKDLKKRVRDLVDPERDLGHSDR